MTVAQHIGVWDSRCPSRPRTTIPHLILPTAGLSEVGDRRQLSMHCLPVEPAVIEFSHRPLCILLTPKLRGKWIGVGNQTQKSLGD